MFLSFATALALFAPLAPLQEPPPRPAPTVSVPSYPNPSCPIMGKPISTKLFADTDKGRIYVCCKSCIQDIQDDVETAYRTAYPLAKKLANTVCPVTAKPITPDSPTLKLQGHEFALCCPKCASEARGRSQVLLAKLNDPKLVDLENKTCPISGEATNGNAFVVIDATIVRLSSAKLADEASQAPAKVLAKARELRAQETKSSK